jgi:hypothetical protein
MIPAPIHPVFWTGMTVIALSTRDEDEIAGQTCGALASVESLEFPGKSSKLTRVGLFVLAAYECESSLKIKSCTIN